MASPTVRARLNWLNSPNSMASETSDPLVRFLQSLGGLHLIVSSASWASASFVPFSTLSRSIYSWKPSLDLPTTLAHTCRFYLRAGVMGERLHHIEHIKQFSKANLDSPALKCFFFFFWGPSSFLDSGDSLPGHSTHAEPSLIASPHSLFLLFHHNQPFSRVLLHLLQVDKFLSLTKVARLVPLACPSTDPHAFSIPSSSPNSFEAFLPP